MAQQLAISLTDAQATPVIRVFNPAKRDGDVYRWDNRSSGIIAGYDQLTISFRPPSKTAKATKVQMVLTCPVLEQTSASTASGIQPAPTVAYANRVEVNFIMHERSNLQNRKDLLAMVRDLIAEQLTADAVHNYDAPLF